MTPVLQNLLDKATARPWTIQRNRVTNYVKGPKGEYIAERSHNNTTNAALIAIAVNHFEELVRVCELVKEFDAASEFHQWDVYHRLKDITLPILAKIEAAAAKESTC